MGIEGAKTFMANVASYAEDIDVTSLKAAAANAAESASKASELTKSLKETQTEDPTVAAQAMATKKLPAPKVIKTKEVEKAKEVQKPVEAAKDSLDKQTKEFSDTHPEFGKEGKTLKDIHSEISESDTPETIIAKVNKKFPLASQAADALEFLSKTTDGDIKKNVDLAKAEFIEKNDAKIKDGREITKLAKEASAMGAKGPVDNIHNIFVDMVANENKVPNLYQQLRTQYPVYKDLMHMLKEVQSKAGATTHDQELGPYLIALNKTIFNLQSLVMTYRTFEKKMPVMDRLMINAIESFNERRTEYETSLSSRKNS